MTGRFNIKLLDLMLEYNPGMLMFSMPLFTLCRRLTIWFGTILTGFTLYWV